MAQQWEVRYVDMKPYQKYRWWIVLFVIIGASGISGWAIAQVANNEITACIKLSNGNTRILIPGSGDTCASNEQSLEWNISGIQGEPGVKGDKGDSGKQVRVKDSLGNDVGQLVSVETVTPTYTVFNEQLGLIINIEGPNSDNNPIATQITPATFQPYYESNDCSGTPLIAFDSSQIFFESVLAIVNNSEDYFKIATASSQMRDVNSHLTGGCETNSYGEILTYEVEEITLPTMSAPLYLTSE